MTDHSDWWEAEFILLGKSFSVKLKFSRMQILFPAISGKNNSGKMTESLWWETWRGKHGWPQSGMNGTDGPRYFGYIFYTLYLVTWPWYSDCIGVYKGSNLSEPWKIHTQTLFITMHAWPFLPEKTLTAQRQPGAGEMKTQWLRADFALAQDGRSFPCSHICWLRAPWDLAPSFGLQEILHSLAIAQTNAHH